MKIRNRITLWITGAGLVAALLFSIVISYELIEQTFTLLDKELSSQAHTLLSGLSLQPGIPVSVSDTSILESLDSSYWFTVYDRQQKRVYASSMAQSVDIPLKIHDNHYNVKATVPRDPASLNQSEDEKVTYRVYVSTISFGGTEYFVQIAKPMKKLWEEIVELVVVIVIGFVIFTFTLIFLGYFVAGKILQPIADINELTQEISDKTLNKRIPLGKIHDELYALSLSLNHMFDRLQFSFKQQKEFIANASHELKTPIALQRVFFDEAIQRHDLPETFKARLVIQSGVTLRMNKLVKNLLDLSALELNDALDMDVINLTELAISTFEEFDETIQAAGIKLLLDMEDAVHLLANTEKMQRVLINLIDNGIKYNLKEDGEIRFSLHRQGGTVRMEISNTGQVIPEDELKLVFNQFYRVEKSRSTALGGSGLGLTIVKQIVELHHGTIVIKNECEPVNRILIKIEFYQ